MRERRKAIEDEVAKLEVEIADYEAALGSFVSMEETRRVTELLNARRADLEALLGEWEEVAQSIEANSLNGPAALFLSGHLLLALVPGADLQAAADPAQRFAPRIGGFGAANRALARPSSGGPGKWNA